MLRCGKPLPSRRLRRVLMRGLVAAVALALISPSAMQVAWAQGGKVATAEGGKLDLEPFEALVSRICRCSWR